jgi:hypothetical protein
MGNAECQDVRTCGIWHLIFGISGCVFQQPAGPT